MKNYLFYVIDRLAYGWFSFSKVYTFSKVCIYFLGGPKPKTIDQAFLIGLVVDFVRKMLPRFNNTDIIYVRSMRASRVAVLNVQCRSVVVAGLVKSTFANLVKQTPTPPFIGNVSLG